MALKKKPVTGMKDMLPAEMEIRDYLIGLIKETYKTFGFTSMETPCVEHIENLCSKQGGDNEKLIFKIMKRGEKLKIDEAKEENDLADGGLRYDLTVPLARYYANHANELPSPFKALQIGNVWRADKPQKGRFRQFTQCDIDILGDETNLAEIELIAATSDMLSQIFAEVGISEFTIHINDRRILSAVALQAGFKEEEIPSVLISLDKFDKIGLDGIHTELVENGYAEDVVERYLAVYKATEAADCGTFCKDIGEQFLDASVISNVEEIISCSKAMISDKVTISFDPTLVRGMGYYTGPIFEVSINGYNFSIAGGGRYDKMIGKFSGQDVHATGFSIGFERIITILKDKMNDGAKISGENQAILIAKDVPLDKKIALFKEAKALREEGAIVTIQPMRKNVKQQITKLENEGFTNFRKIYKD